MSYHITYRADDWVRAEGGTPEQRQVIIEDLDDTTRLVVVVIRGVLAGPPRVAGAWIEQAYVTRTAGWKRRTIRRVDPREITLAERDAPPNANP
jgi:hypothetical protein